MPPRLFYSVYRELLAALSSARQPCIVAVDGSRVRVPPSLAASSFRAREGRGRHVRRVRLLSCATDVSTGRVLDYRFGPGMDERAHAGQLFDSLPPGSIAIFDRGYFSRALVEAAWVRGIYVIMRVRRNACAEVTEWVQQGQLQQTAISVGCVPCSLARFVHDGHTYHCLTTAPLDVDELQRLYKLRWEVEIAFKCLKHVFGTRAMRTTSLTVFCHLLDVAILCHTASSWGVAARMLPPIQYPYLHPGCRRTRVAGAGQSTPWRWPPRLVRHRHDRALLWGRGGYAAGRNGAR